MKHGIINNNGCACALYPIGTKVSSGIKAMIPENMKSPVDG